MVFIVQTKQQLDSLFRQNKVVVIYLYTKWCGPCKGFAPLFEELATSLQKDSRVVCAKVDAETNWIPVTSVPTIMFFVQGKEVHRVIGADIGSVRATLAQLFAPAGSTGVGHERPSDGHERPSDSADDVKQFGGRPYATGGDGFARINDAYKP
jgi:thiol-disulfide isomerase/thioredoxin